MLIEFIICAPVLQGFLLCLVVMVVGGSVFHPVVCTPSSREVKAGTWRQEMKQRHEGLLLTDLLLFSF